MRGNYLKAYRQAFMMCLCWITLLFPLYPIHSQNHERSQSQVTSFTDSSAYHADKKDKKKLRQQYYEQLHRTAPEVDWKQMDQNARIAKAKSRFQRVRTQRQLEDGVVTIAQGELKGTWREIGSKNLSGRIHLAEYDPGNDQVYLGSAPGNIWKSKLDGSNWQVQNDLMRISHLIQLRRIPHGNQHRIIAASSQPKFGVVYSDDDGLTWNFANGLKFYAEWGYLDKMVIANDPGRTVYILVNEWDNQNWGGITSVYASYDQGENFVMLQSFRHSTFGDAGKFDIWTDYYGSGKVYLLENNHIRKLDNENRFNIIGTISLVDDGNDIRLAGRETSTGTYLYALYPDRNVYESDIYQSKDDGKNWTFRGTVSQRPFHENSFESSRVNPEHVFIGGVECFRSYDGGTTWEIVNRWGHYYGNPEVNLHADICGIQPFVTKSGKEFILISTDGGTYISDDELLTVKNISLSGLNVSQYYSVYTNRNNTEVIYAGSQDQGIQRSTSDNGSIRDFEQMLSGDYGHIVSGDGGKSVWANYPGFSIYYPDAENSTYSKRWYFSGNGYHDFIWMRPLMPDPTSPEKVFLAGGSISGTGGSHIIHLNASGGSIQAEELPYNFKAASGGIISAMAYSPIDPNYRYVMTENGRFFLSTDGGNSWEMTQGFDGPDHFWLYGSSILPSRSQLGKVYIAGSGYSNPPVFVSDNHGKDFVAMSNSMPSTLVYQLDANPDESLIFAATEIGPYVYITENGQWYDMDGTSAPDQIYWTVDYVPELRTARFGTHGRGIFDFKINTLPPVVINPLMDVQAAKNSASMDIDLSEVFSDAEEPFSALTLIASSSNTSVVTTSINSSILTLHFVTNAVGVADITVRATDTGGEFVEDVFTVSVTDPGVSFEVLYRSNAGGGSLTGTPGWESDTDNFPSPYRTGGTRGAVSDAITLDGSVPSGVPANLFKTERYWKAGQTAMVWSFPVEAGNQVEIRVYLAETYFQAAGQRVFDILIDGVLVENDIDVYSLVGHDVGMMRSYEVVSDGMVDISFGRVVENPAIKGIEIMGESDGGGENIDPVADAGSDQSLTDSDGNGSEDVVLDGSGSSDADGTIVSYAWSEGGTPIASGVNPVVSLGVGIHTITLTVTDDDNDTDTDQVVITIDPASPGVSFDEVLYRVNAGGGSLSGTPAWESDTDNFPSSYRTGGTRGAVSAAITLDGSVPGRVPANLFKTERYWKAKQTAMVWSFPVEAGNQVDVRVYLAETYFNAAGLRVFDILIDGVLVENDIDVYSLVGHDVGLMRSYAVVSDGMVDISFGRVVENPAIKGIEIIGESSGQNMPPVADRVPSQLLKDSDENNSEPVIQDSVQLSVYPNPATGKVNIVFRGDEANHTVIEIFNMLGHPMHRFDGNGNVEEEVNVSKFYKGIYVVRAITEGKIFSKRLIIE